MLSAMTSIGAMRAEASAGTWFPFVQFSACLKRRCAGQRRLFRYPAPAIRIRLDRIAIPPPAGQWSASLPDAGGIVA